MRTERTPGPWKMGGNKYDPRSYSVDAGVYGVCKLYTLGKDADEIRANAAFIVTACNNFDELLAACEGLISLWGKNTPVEIEPGEIDPEWLDIIANIAAAIAAAKGE